jgi:hypothetical protein
MLVALAFVVATVAAALAGLVIGLVTKPRHLIFGSPIHVGLMTLSPYATAIALLARAEHGAIAAIAIVAGFLSRSFVRRLFHRARSTVRHAAATGAR